MQETSPEFEAAVAAHRTWVPPQLRTDWDGTGYGGDGTIDDLTPQMGETWEVDHTLDDGYPDSVTFVAGTSVPELTTELAGRSYPSPTAPIPAAAYWSPLRTDSPVYGLDRDIAPVTLDVGLVTETGVERVRVFTGQMVNTPVKGGKASLQTISATRLKLMALVQPPAFTSIYAKGLYATWPISYALAASGVYAGPQIRPSTAWYAPMHGSAWAMIPSANRVYSATELLTGPNFPYWTAYDWDAGGGPVLRDEVDWITGPYVSAPDLELSAATRRAMYTEGLSFETSASDVFSQAGCAARLEMWVRGDATDVNNAPGGSASVSRLCSLWGQADVAGAPYFRLGITPTRNVEVTVYDTGTTWTLTSSGTLPTDGEWYFVGAGYDMVADRLWVNLNGVVQSSTAGMVDGILPATDSAWYPGYPIFFSALPVAEVTLTTGAEANVDDYPLWRDDASFAPTAVLHPSAIKLRAMAEPEPREAWQIIADYARSELASVRLTELDVFEYLPIAWWVQDAQQVVVDSFDTATNAAAFDIDLDPTKIRNSVKVNYTEVTPASNDPEVPDQQEIYTYSDTNPILSIPPGVTVLRFPYSGTGVLPGQSLEKYDGVSPPASSVGWVTLNDVIDGTGSYATVGITVTFDEWTATSATLRFVNVTPFTYYLVNDIDIAPLRILGIAIEEEAAYVTDSDATSIAARGERSIDVPGPGLQTEESARRLARNVKMGLRYAVPTIGADQQGVTVTGNPARQPGDLATFRDTLTGVDGGLWRLRGVHHQGDGAQYRQAVVARAVLPIMIIGEGRVGESLIGPSQD